MFAKQKTIYIYNFLGRPRIWALGFCHIPPTYSSSSVILPVKKTCYFTLLRVFSFIFIVVLGLPQQDNESPLISGKICDPGLQHECFSFSWRIGASYQLWLKIFTTTFSWTTRKVLLSRFYIKNPKRNRGGTENGASRYFPCVSMVLFVKQ